MSMTLDMLRYFVAVAKRGSFTEAAEDCYVSQPALSRAIASLEREVGCALIDRDVRKKVALTPVGEVMLVEAKRVLLRTEVLLERVRHAQLTQQRYISMGYISGGLLRHFRKKMKDVLEELSDIGIRILPEYGSAREIRERVLSGELDCALLPEHCILDMYGCRHETVMENEMRAIIPEGHPLFHEKEIGIEQLRNSKFVFFHPGELPVLFASQLELCQRAGFTPQIAAYAHKMDDMYVLITQCMAVGFISEAFEYSSAQDIRLLPIWDGVKPYRNVIIARKEAVNPSVDRLFEKICARGTAQG